MTKESPPRPSRAPPDLDLRIEHRSVSDLRPAGRQARHHNKRQLAGIEASIRQFGFVSPVLINREGKLLAGVARVEAAKRIGMTTVPAVCIDHLMETNFFGVLRCAKAVIPGMRQRRSGCIVNVSSVAGRLAIPPQGAYAASKWAVEAMTECLAQEMKVFGVRVALIEPGVIATPIFGKAPPPIENSPYPHAKRMGALFASSLEHPVSPFVVADQIVAIAKGEAGDRLRYPVGPDAQPFIDWRRSKTDEEMVAMGGFTDAEYVASVKADFGLDVTL
jgi:NAD(P)-dependent dehydrogenase (short-subunit alcohol dehydrogenase family)